MAQLFGVNTDAACITKSCGTAKHPVPAMQDEAGVTLAIHGGDSSYAPYERIWGRSCDSLYADPRSWMESMAFWSRL